MREEMESIWNAMKGQHYKRTIRQLTESIKDVRSLDDALPAALEMVLNAIHAQTGTFWFYDRFRDGRIHPRVACDGANMAEVSLLPGGHPQRTARYHPGLSGRPTLGRPGG